MSEQDAIQPELEFVEETLAVTAVQDMLSNFMESARVEAVFGEPVRNGDTIIIPAAEVVSFAGFGVGSGSGPTDEGGLDAASTGRGGGGGGGGSVYSRPVAVVIASPEGVQVKPVVDLTKISLALLTTVGFMAVSAYQILTYGRRR